MTLSNLFFLVGDHGYDNSLPSMHPFMAASGPSFRQGYKMRSLQSVDLYPLMCYLLQIPAQPNNGSLSHAKCLMATAVSSEGFVVVSLVVGVILFLMTTIGKWKDVSKDQCCVQTRFQPSYSPLPNNTANDFTDLHSNC